MENLLRTDISEVEEAQAYEQLVLGGMDAKVIAAKTGRSLRTVKSRLKLNDLPEKAREQLHDGQATLADAQALLEFADDHEASAASRQCWVTGTSRTRCRTNEHADSASHGTPRPSRRTRSSVPSRRPPRTSPLTCISSAPLTCVKQGATPTASAWVTSGRSTPTANRSWCAWTPSHTPTRKPKPATRHCPPRKPKRTGPAGHSSRRPGSQREGPGGVVGQHEGSYGVDP